MWSYGTIEPSSSTEIASEDNAYENSEFCEDMSKWKNPNRVIFIIYLRLICLIFQSFLLELYKTLESDWQEIKISTRIKKFHFGVKYAVFIEKKIVWKILIFATHGLMTIFNNCSKF